MPEIPNLERVIEILQEELPVTYLQDPLDREIGYGSNLLEVFGADSLDLIEISFALEDEFDIEIPPGVEATWDTVIDIVKTLNEALGE